MKSVLRTLLGWTVTLASIAGVFYFYVVKDNIPVALAFSFLIVVGVTICMTATDEKYNRMSSTIKRISDTKGISYKKLKEDFMLAECPLGKPWIGRASLLVKDSLVFGPTAAGELLYIYYRGSSCYISGTGLENVKNAENLDHAYNCAGKNLVRSAYNTVKKYLETGKVEWIIK